MLSYCNSKNYKYIRRRRRRSENLHFRCHSLSETRLQNRSESSFYTTIIEKIRKFIIVKDDFTHDNGLLTPTMKIKKDLVFEKFEKQIEDLYS